MSDTKVQSFTVRIPKALYTASAKVAQQRHVSLNTLIQESLSAQVREQKEQMLYDAFTIVGEDEEASDVSFAFAAQAEVVLRDEQ